MLNRRTLKTAVAAISMLALTTGLGLSGTIPALAATPAASAASPDYTAGDIYKIVNYHYGECIFERLGAENCTQGATDEKWLLQATSNSGYYKFVSQSDGFCISIAVSPDDADMTTDPCAQGDNYQKWKLQATSAPGYYKLVDLGYSDSCIFEGSGGYINVETCTAGDGTQWWRLQPAS
jgi:hypothetical protein